MSENNVSSPPAITNGMKKPQLNAWKTEANSFFFLNKCPEGCVFMNIEKKILLKPQRSTTHSIFWWPFYLPILLAYMVRAFTRTTTPPRSAKKQGIWRHEPRESRAAQPTIPALDIHVNRQYLRSTCLLYTSPSPRDLSTSRMPSSAWKKNTAKAPEKYYS